MMLVKKVEGEKITLYCPKCKKEKTILKKDI